MITLLDLGGTACFESREAVSVSLDGSASGDMVVHRVIGDYRALPFADNTFVEAFGACFLEDDALDIYWALREVIQVTRVDGIIKLKGCGGPENYHYKIPSNFGLELSQEPTFYFDQGYAYYDDPFVWHVYESSKEMIFEEPPPERPGVVTYDLIASIGDQSRVIKLTSESGFIRGSFHDVHFLLVKTST